MSGILPFSPDDYELEQFSVPVSAPSTRILPYDSSRVFFSIDASKVIGVGGENLTFNQGTNAPYIVLVNTNVLIEYTFYKNYIMTCSEVWFNTIGGAGNVSILTVCYKPYKRGDVGNVIRRPKSLAAKIRDFSQRHWGSGQ